MNRILSALLFGCSLIAIGSSNTSWAQVKAAPPISGVKGKLQSVTSNSLDVVSPNGVVHVTFDKSLVTYGRVPSDLNHVSSTSYVGITSAKDANGKEVAKEIHIFPAELRGAGEGSNMIDGAAGSTSHSRMTNGSVSRPNTAASGSRMTNGSVQKQGTALVVQYQDGAQTISVPQDAVVTQIVPQKVTLTAGDTVYVATEKKADGSLTTNKVYLIAAKQ
jgi:hypothetical protein